MACRQRGSGARVMRPEERRGGRPCPAAPAVQGSGSSRTQRGRARAHSAPPPSPPQLGSEPPRRGRLVCDAVCTSAYCQRQPTPRRALCRSTHLLVRQPLPGQQLRFAALPARPAARGAAALRLLRLQQLQEAGLQAAALLARVAQLPACRGRGGPRRQLTPTPKWTSTGSRQPRKRRLHGACDAQGLAGDPGAPGLAAAWWAGSRRQRQ